MLPEKDLRPRHLTGVRMHPYYCRMEIFPILINNYLKVESLIKYSCIILAYNYTKCDKYALNSSLAYDPKII